MTDEDYKIIWTKVISYVSELIAVVLFQDAKMSFVKTINSESECSIILTNKYTVYLEGIYMILFNNAKYNG